MRPIVKLQPALLGAALAAALGCAARQSVETTAAKALISDQESQQLGDQIQKQLADQGVRVVQDPVVEPYLREVAQPIFDQAARQRPGVTFRLHLIDDPKVVNAFATPGGHLYVYSGLIEAVHDSAELAGVLAHETGHVALYHPQRQMVDALGLDALSKLALGSNAGAAKQLAANVAQKGLLLANSRGDETQADEFGAQAMAGAGYDPNALIRFFETLEKQEGKSPALMTWLSDHPSTPNRVQDLKRFIAEHHLEGHGRKAPGLQAAQDRLRSGAHGQAGSAAKPNAG
jgi:predicted Zn-dependent protease